MNDAQLIEHLHARGWSLDKIDVAMIREGAAALQADALAAIKAARVQALSGVEVCEEFDALSKRVNWNTLSSVNAAWHAFKCAIKFSERRLLGEDAGRGEWVALTDEDRDRAFNRLDGGLTGFMKLWGWLHYAKAIEDICREKNAGGMR